jgi:hypothetical protein
LLRSVCKFTQAVPHTFGVLAGQPQTPLKQTWLPGQALPQAPQLRGSFERFTSQPLAGFRSQSANPALQVKEQQFATQVGVLFGAIGQVPAETQLGPETQVEVQVPLEHCWPAAHFTPQAPQLFASVCVFAQTVAGPLPQAVMPAGQV